jgi:hypothetical protein
LSSNGLPVKYLIEFAPDIRERDVRKKVVFQCVASVANRAHLGCCDRVGRKQANPKPANPNLLEMKLKALLD